MRDGHLEASGHNWVEGQGAGPRIDKGDAEDDTMYDAMGNKIDNKKAKKLTASEARKVRNRRYLFFALTYRFNYSPLGQEGPDRSEETRRGHRRRDLRSSTLFCFFPLCSVLFFALCLS
jgi:hypothetical protein